MASVLVNGVNLNVKVIGSGPPVVALHGFAGAGSTWDDFVNEAMHEFSIITIDLLGHGSSDSPTDPARYRIERATADIFTVLDKLSVKRASWLGYSMGGRIALVAATLIPNRFASLVLESASPGLSSEEARQARARSDEALAQMISEQGIERFSAHWEEQPLFSSRQLLPPDVQQRIRDQRLRSNPVGLANSLRQAGAGTQPPVDQSLSTIKASVLCVTGEYDKKYNAIATDMCSRLPNGQCYVIGGAGHAPHLEKPRDFNEIVLKFLREQRPW